MKNKELSYKVSFFSIIGIIAILIYLACSCTSQNIPYKQAPKEWKCEPEKKYKPKKVRGHANNSRVWHQYLKEERQ